MKIHPECAIRCQGYAYGDFVCGEFCEKLAVTPDISLAELYRRVNATIAWLRGQEWTGDKPTRGEAADALEQMLQLLAHLEQHIARLEEDLGHGEKAKEAIAEMVESELECGQFTDGPSIADYIREGGEEMHTPGNLHATIKRLREMLAIEFMRHDRADFIRECARSTALEADRTELQAKVGHLEQAYERLLDDMCDGFKAAGLTKWMSCGDGIRQLRARAESAEKANPARAAIKKATE